MQDILFEEGLQARIYQHKLTMLMAKIARQYIDEQSKGEVKIPMFQLEEQAFQVANKTAQNIIFSGKLEEEYNNAWEYMKNIIPDNYSTLL